MLSQSINNIGTTMECPVCHETIYNNHMFSTNCGHVFHGHCIKNCLTRWVFILSTILYDDSLWEPGILIFTASSNVQHAASRSINPKFSKFTSNRNSSTAKCSRATSTSSNCCWISNQPNPRRLRCDLNLRFRVFETKSERWKSLHLHFRAAQMSKHCGSRSGAKISSFRACRITILNSEKARLRMWSRSKEFVDNWTS